jgi:hypothetical protein
VPEAPDAAPGQARPSRSVFAKETEFVESLRAKAPANTVIQANLWEALKSLSFVEGPEGESTSSSAPRLRNSCRTPRTVCSGHARPDSSADPTPLALANRATK